eukprot:scaffold25589_cov21-Tisochrysis_lutea.AAC.1
MVEVLIGWIYVLSSNLAHRPLRISLPVWRQHAQGTNASPLRKALNDSGLGSALLGGGMDDELKQPIF